MIIARLAGLLLFAIGLYLIIRYTKKALQNSDLTGKLEEQENLKGRLVLVRQLSPEQIRKNREEIKKQTEEI